MVMEMLGLVRRRRFDEVWNVGEMKQRQYVGDNGIPHAKRALREYFVTLSFLNSAA